MNNKRFFTVLSVKTLGTLALSGFLALLLPTFASSTDNEHLRVTGTIQTKSGRVRGVIDDGVEKFLGIPFAAAPVGGLRWQPPKPPKPWHKVLNAVHFGNRCVQTNTLGDFAATSVTEDCLYINVMRPVNAVSVQSDDEKLKPVMVWIPGGGLIDGSSNEYDGSKLVKDGDVVFVSMNYRVNIFGFMAHPSIDGEGHSAVNYGIMDMQEALRWVQQNIQAFGGDPKNVTIFGESAGATDVTYLMISPESKGLFQKAIMESSAYVPVQSTYEAAVKRGEELASALKCGKDSGRETARCLRAASTSAIIATGIPSLFPVRAVDGKILPMNLGQAFATGQFLKVPVISGGNLDEYAWFQGMAEIAKGRPMGDADYPSAMVAAFGAALAPAVLDKYPLSKYTSPSLALVAAQTDRGFSCSTRRLNRLLARYIPVYAYEFTDRAAPFYFQPVSFPYGAAHTLELQYLFTGFRGATGTFKPLNAEQKGLSDAMVRYWTTFAHTGTPNAKGLPKWDRYVPSRDNYQSLMLPQPSPTQQFSAAHMCDFWDSIDGS